MTTLCLSFFSITELIWPYMVAVSLISTSRERPSHLFITADSLRGILSLNVLLMGRRFCHFWLYLQTFTDVDALIASNASVADSSWLVFIQMLASFGESTVWLIAWNRSTLSRVIWVVAKLCHNKIIRLLFVKVALLAPAYLFSLICGAQVLLSQRVVLASICLEDVVDIGLRWMNSWFRSVWTERPRRLRLGLARWALLLWLHHNKSQI